MKKFHWVNKAMAIGLAATMVAGLPTVTMAEDTSEDGKTTCLLVATDRHEFYSEFDTKYSAKTNNLEQMLTAVKDLGVDSPSAIMLSGDNVGRSGKDPSGDSCYYLSDIDEELANVYGEGTIASYYTYGSHDKHCLAEENGAVDNGDGTYTFNYSYDGFLTGPAVMDGYYLYGISYSQVNYATDEQAEADIAAKKEAGTELELDISDKNGISATSASEKFLEWVDTLDDNKPIVVGSHMPIHFWRNDNLGGLIWAKAFNKAAETHDVIFIWGHNHTCEEQYYAGREAQMAIAGLKDQDYYLQTPGDTMGFPTADGTEEDIEINFTYMNAGYLKLGYISTISFTDREGDGIYDELTLRRYSAHLESVTDTHTGETVDIIDYGTTEYTTPFQTELNFKTGSKAASTEKVTVKVTSEKSNAGSQKVNGTLYYGYTVENTATGKNMTVYSDSADGITYNAVGTTAKEGSTYIFEINQYNVISKGAQIQTGASSDKTTLLVATDRHEFYSEFDTKYSAKTNNLEQMLTAVKNLGVDEPSAILLSGDNVGRSGKDPSGDSCYYLSDIDEELANVYGEDTIDSYYTYGSHDKHCLAEENGAVDNGDGTYTFNYSYDGFLTGPAVMDGYYLYGISYSQVNYATDEQAEADIAAKKEAGTELELDIDDPNGISATSASEKFLEWVDTLEDNAPIVVGSHMPIHFWRNDNLGGLIWAKAFNKAAETHDVIFIWGHNHTCEEQYYNGKEATMAIAGLKDQDYYLQTPGDTMGFPTADGEEEDIEINFTYMNAGYLKLGYISTITFEDLGGDGVYDELTLRRYSAHLETVTDTHTGEKIDIIDYGTTEYTTPFQTTLKFASDERTTDESTIEATLTTAKNDAGCIKVDDVLYYGYTAKNTATGEDIVVYDESKDGIKLNGYKLIADSQYAFTINEYGIILSVKVESDTEKVSMHRLYNPNSGEHLYTSNAKEVKSLTKLGWQYEGVAWTAPVTSDAPVYRLYNPNTGDHHYTVSAEERDWLEDLGWMSEGIAWYSGGNATVYRLFNPNVETATHHYTGFTAEKTWLTGFGWLNEGVAWYALEIAE